MQRSPWLGERPVSKCPRCQGKWPGLCDLASYMDVVRLLSLEKLPLFCRDLGHLFRQMQQEAAPALWAQHWALLASVSAGPGCSSCMHAAPSQGLEPALVFHTVKHRAFHTARNQMLSLCSLHSAASASARGTKSLASQRLNKCALLFSFGGFCGFGFSWNLCQKCSSFFPKFFDWTCLAGRVFWQEGGGTFCSETFHRTCPLISLA